MNDHYKVGDVVSLNNVTIGTLHDTGFKSTETGQWYWFKQISGLVHRPESYEDMVIRLEKENSELRETLTKLQVMRTS